MNKLLTTISSPFRGNAYKPASIPDEEDSLEWDDFLPDSERRGIQRSGLRSVFGERQRPVDEESLMPEDFEMQGSRDEENTGAQDISVSQSIHTRLNADPQDHRDGPASDGEPADDDGDGEVDVDSETKSRQYWAFPFWKHIKTKDDLSNLKGVIRMYGKVRSLRSKFDNRREKDVLDKLTGMYTDLVKCTSDLHHPLHVLSLNGLADAWLEQHKLADDDDDTDQLDQAIIYFLQAVSDATNSCHEGETAKQEQLISLTQAASALRKRYTLRHASDDLDQIIEFDYQIIELKPKNPFVHHCNYGGDLITRYNIKHVGNDLDTAVSALREALRLCPANRNSRKIKILGHLASALATEHTLTLKPAILNECIQRYNEALALTGIDHSQRPPLLRNVAAALGRRHEHTHHLEDLNAAIRHLRQARDVCDIQDRKEYFFPLSTALFNLYYLTSNPDVLREVVDLRKDCVDFCEEVDGSVVPFMVGYAEALHASYRHHGDPTVLETAIDRLCGGLELDTKHLMCKAHLAITLSDRYDRYKNQQDLLESTKLHRQVIEAFADNDSQRGNFLLSFSRVLDKTFVQSHNTDYLEESISVSREISLLKTGSESWKAHANLAGLLMKQYQLFEKQSSLNEAIENYEKALGCPRDRGERPTILNSLAMALASRTGPSANHDLDRGIVFLLESEKLCPLGHPSHARSLYNIGRLYMSKHKQSGDSKHFDESMKAFSRAVHDPHRPPLSRYLFAKGWIEAVSSQTSLDAQKDESISDAYEQAILLLPQLASFGLDVNTRLEHLNDSAGLACSAADHILRTSKVKKAETALELLEQGRSVFWSQALQLRTKFLDLPDDMSRRLTEISSELEVKGHNSPGDGNPTAETEANRRKNLASEFNLLVSSARAMPGFRDFLKPEVFERLAAAAECGPVVVLVPGTPHCHALAITYPPKVIHVPLLGVNVRQVQKWVRDFHGLKKHPTSSKVQKRDMSTTGLSGGHSTPPKHDDNNPCEDDGLSEERPGSRHVGTGKRLSSDEVVGVLWSCIVQRVFTKLDLKKNTGGKRPRLWWCPTGPFVFLPMHAAGIYGETRQVTDCVSDYVIPSYTPTLTSLINARKGKIPSDPKVLLVGQPTTPGHSSISNTREELKALTKVLKSYNSESLLHINNQTNCNVTVAEVEAQLSEASVLHLACHGSQNKANPLESGFFLEDGTLTVEKLMKLKNEGALFAFLSACESASGDSRLPDEAVHLAATMMFSGFRSVVGTMWEMGDSDGPRIAKAVYEALFQSADRQLDLDAVPTALDAAVRSLRDEKVPSSRWATYIHMGI